MFVSFDNAVLSKISNKYTVSGSQPQPLSMLSSITFVGVYLSLNGVAGIQNNTCTSINNVGTSPPHQLACVTDRMPCCQGQPNLGYWHSPTLGNQLDTVFHENRTNDGQINLFRSSESTISYNGLLCCTATDLNNDYHTLCVNLG